MRLFLFLFLSLFAAVATAKPLSPADSLLNRIDPGAAEKIATRLDTRLPQDCFVITSRRGKPMVKGDSYVSIATGIHWYLKYYCGIDLSWSMMHARLPETLPVPRRDERHRSKARLRYYLNYCTFSYSMAFWDWARWQEEIDWMALHGVNLCLATVGTDAVWLETLRRLHYSGEPRQFIAGAAFQAWWLMNNLEGWGGPESDALIARHEALQRRIVGRMRELGIEPVLPGYAGMVPHDAREKMQLSVQDPGRWCGYHRPAFLQPTDGRFASIAAVYYAVLDSLYGPARYYSMDPFHEGGSSEGVDLRQAGRALWQAMKHGHPDACWVIQGWGDNPRPQLMAGVPEGDLLVLDLNAENVPKWNTATKSGQLGFGPHRWLWCELLNFGGNTGLFGRMDATLGGYYQALGGEKRQTLDGVGLTMEGIGNNEILFDLVLELPWHADSLTADRWVATYAATHYGRALRGESLYSLSRTIWNCPQASPQQGTTESVFCARPGDRVWQVSSWSNMQPYYRPEDVIRAAIGFAGGLSDSVLMANDNYRHDLVDILRQGLAEKGRLTYRAFQQAMACGDSTAMRRSADSFLRLLLLQDSLLATRPEFMLGTWIAGARRQASTPEEADRLEWNARVQVTTWGLRPAADGGGLHDYAHKEWSGLLRDFYFPRWQHYFSRVLAGNHEPVDWYAFEEPFTLRHDAYPTTPRGDLEGVARRVVEELR